MYRTTLLVASGDVSKTVKPDGMILPMKIDYLNPASVNGAVLLKINKNWIDLASILQYSNYEIIICFWQRSLTNP